MRIVSIHRVTHSSEKHCHPPGLFRGVAALLRWSEFAKPNMMRAIAQFPALRSVARIVLAANAVIAASAMLVVPVPAWGWAALRAFLQF